MLGPPKRRPTQRHLPQHHPHHSPNRIENTADPTPVTPGTPNTPTPYLHGQAPEHEHLIAKRTAAATRLLQLHSQGLTTHVAQALWRTATAGDASFTARAIGLDSATANTLDTITSSLFEQWLNRTFTCNDNIQLFTSINDGGFGFTSTLNIKDTALVAS